ncbi:hypothetical protein AAHB37_03840 [Glutamicibacter halophytocola]|uniref:hypothetical protein n=1 Tax=Glutamicibacter halophytocola TaxID=1933880 RepID=UPI003218E554
MEVDSLDYKSLVKSAGDGICQREMAVLLSMSQLSVAKTTQCALSLPVVLKDFNAASSFKVSPRYAAGFIDRDESVSQLIEWPDKPTPWAKITASLICAWKDPGRR